MIRPATPDDVPTIARLIRELADYERLLHVMTLEEERLRDHLFGPRRYIEVLLAEEEAMVVGFALFFHSYSTFACKPRLYLEDLFVVPEQRGKGYGKALFRELARLAIERDCPFVEWSVLNWNELAIHFYKSLGAKPMDEWTVYRLSGEAIAKLAAAK